MATKKYKLKTTFNDFYVEERLDYSLTDSGAYYLFKLDKWGLDTIGALRITSKRLRVPRKKIGYSGLKDRYSHSGQYITIPKNEIRSRKAPEELEFSDRSINLEYLGEVEKQLRLGRHSSNFFRITIRRLTASSLSEVSENINNFQSGCMVPNYFDSQKFGFLGGPTGFFAPNFLKGDYENALKMVIAKPNRKERPRSKTVHKYLQGNWGDWSACNEFLTEHNFENYLRLTTYLEKNPEDYLGAIKLLTKDILKLKITAFQAFLWNEYLKKELRDKFKDAEFVDVKYHVGTLLLPKNPDDMKIESGEEIETIPLPSFDLEKPYRGYYGELLRWCSLFVVRIRTFHVRDCRIADHCNHL